MKKNITAIFFSLTILYSYAQYDNRVYEILDDTSYQSIDLTYKRCTESDSGSTTVGIMDCAAQANKKWEAQINKYYKLLLETCETENQKEKLKKSQDNWGNFRKSEDNLYWNGLFNLDGSMWTDVRITYDMYLARNRALQLQLYYETLHQH